MLGLKLNHISKNGYWLAVDVNMINPWGHGINSGFSTTQIRILWLFTYLFNYSTDIVFDIWSQINGLAQDCSNSNASAKELLQSCAKPSKCGWMYRLFWILECIVWEHQAQDVYQDYEHPKGVNCHHNGLATEFLCEYIFRKNYYVLKMLNCTLNCW